MLRRTRYNVCPYCCASHNSVDYRYNAEEDDIQAFAFHRAHILKAIGSEICIGISWNPTIEYAQMLSTISGVIQLKLSMVLSAKTVIFTEFSFDLVCLVCLHQLHQSNEQAKE